MDNNPQSDDKLDAPARIWNKAFIGVFIANANMSLAQMMSNALIAKYVDHLGAAPAVVGSVVGSFAITALLFKVVSAPAIDSFNRRLILMGAMSIMAIAFFGYSVSVSIPMMFFFRMLQGTGMAFSASCCLALAADSLPKDKFGSGIGVFSMGQAACMAVAPSIALWLLDEFGYKMTFTINGSLMALAILAALMIKTPTREKKEFRISINSILAKEAVVPTFISFFMAMAFCVVGSFLIIYAGTRGVDNIGLYFTVYAGTMLFTRPMVGKLTDKFGLVKVLAPAIVLFAAAFLLISFANVLWMFLLAAFIAACGYGACQPAIQTLAMKSVPADKRGAASSTIFIGMDVAFLFGPILAGTIVGLFGYSTMWRITLIPMSIALTFVLLSRRRIMEVEKSFAERNAK